MSIEMGFVIVVSLSVLWMAMGLIFLDKKEIKPEQTDYDDVLLAMTFGPLILLTKKKEEK